MMKLEYGNMWDVWNEADLFVISCNSYLKKDGSLVMGRGIAREARDKFEGVDDVLGAAVEKECGHLGRYSLIVSREWQAGKKLAIGQVKRNFADKADIDLIRGFLVKLGLFAAENRDVKIHMNFPGIGNGGLKKGDVLPLLNRLLPDNVHVWQKV